MAKKPIEDDFLTGASLGSEEKKSIKKSDNKPKASIKISKNTAKIIKSVICAVIVLALLVTYVATGTVRKGFVASLSLPAQTLTGVTVSNGEQKAKIKVSTYNFYFATTYNSLRSQKDQYSQYGIDPADIGLDVDFDLKLSQQKYTDKETNETTTWDKHIHQLVLDSIESTYTYYLAAVEANGGEDPELTDEQQNELQEMLKSYRENANKYGYTLSGYLVKAMGKGVTEKVLVTETTRQYIAQNYKDSLSKDIESKEYTADDINAYKDEHLSELQSVDLKIFDCANEDDAKAFAKALKADGSNFADLAAKYSESDTDKENYADPAFTIEVGATRDAITNAGFAIGKADPHNHEEGEEHSEDEEPTYSGLDWIFSADRKAGDIKQSSTSVVYIIAPASLQDRNTINVRHILVKPETTDDEDATPEQWAAAYKEAKDLLKDWKTGNKSEKSFSDFAQKYTDDTGSKDNGGLYENVITGQMVNPFSNWCFDSARKTGDTGIVKTSYGYHIMYFVGANEDKVWEYNAKQALAKEDGASASDKLEEEYTIKVNWFGSRYFEKDIDIDN